MKLFERTLFVGFSLLLFLYMMWPFGPRSIADFPALPQSVKSTLSGDTTEVANISAYFSDNYRKFVIPYYYLVFQGLSKFPIPPLELNYPPEDAYIYVKDQTQSTYLEEIAYPLRDSIFVNGLEPFDEKTTEPRYAGASKFSEAGRFWQTKVTLRFYHASLLARFAVLILIICSLYLLRMVFVKYIKIKNG
jgi:hypothetical protein